MDDHPRRQTGWPVFLLAVGLLALLFGAALTLLDGVLRQRTGLDAAGLQATLDGVRAAYAQADIDPTQNPNGDTLPDDASLAPRTAFERQLDAMIAQTAPGYEALARWVLQALPYVRWRFALLYAGGAFALAGVLWLASRRASTLRDRRAHVHRKAEENRYAHAPQIRGADGTAHRHTSVLMEEMEPPAKAPPPIHCLGCGASLRANARFCGTCGRPAPY
jgi:hypothetical protein